MHRYTAIKTVEIASGIVELSADQAEQRADKLSVINASQYAVLKPIQLKAGEKFGYDGALCQSVASGQGLENAAEVPETPVAETEEINIAEIEAIDVETVMGILGLKFRDVQALLKEKYGVSVLKKADEITGDVFREIAITHNLGEAIKVEKQAQDDEEGDE